VIARGLIGDAGRPAYTGPYPVDYTGSGASGQLAKPGDYTLVTASGVALLGAGLVTAAIGIVLWIRNDTSVTTEDGRSIGAATPTPGLRLTAQGWAF
jgi:hypothetical protein